jgi:hypothetical protein
MLSYVLPVEEKPPPAPDKNLLQLELQNHNHVAAAATTVLPECDSRNIVKTATTVKASTLSSESSVSSISSSTASQHTMTPTDRPRPKLGVNGSKHASLKR